MFFNRTGADNSIDITGLITWARNKRSFHCWLQARFVASFQCNAMESFVKRSNIDTHWKRSYVLSNATRTPLFLQMVIGRGPQRSVQRTSAFESCAKIGHSCKLGNFCWQLAESGGAVWFEIGIEEEKWAIVAIIMWAVRKRSFESYKWLKYFTLLDYHEKNTLTKRYFMFQNCFFSV